MTGGGVLALIVVGVVLYKVTRHQDVPRGSTCTCNVMLKTRYHWITQNTGRNVVLDTIKSIGSGDQVVREARAVAAARPALDRRDRARLRDRLHARRSAHGPGRGRVNGGDRPLRILGLDHDHAGDHDSLRLLWPC